MITKYLNTTIDNIKRGFIFFFQVSDKDLIYVCLFLIPLTLFLHFNYFANYVTLYLQLFFAGYCCWKCLQYAGTINDYKILRELKGKIGTDNTNNLKTMWEYSHRHFYISRINFIIGFIVLLFLFNYNVHENWLSAYVVLFWGMVIGKQLFRVIWIAGDAWILHGGWWSKV